MSYQQVRQDIQSGQFDQAIACIDELLDLDPNQANLWQAKAVALIGLDRIGEAIIAVDQAIRLQPSMGAAHRLLGRARNQLGNYSGAIEAYKQAMQCYINQNDKASAQACLSQIDALRVKQSPPESITQQTTQQHSAPSPVLSDTLSSFVTPLIETPPVSEQVLLDRAIANIQTGHYRDARQDLDWLLTIDATNSEALAQRALLHAYCHNHQAAVQDITDALQCSPHSSMLQLQRGQIRLLMGDTRGAIADFSLVLRANEPLTKANMAQIHRLRGQAHQQLNDVEAALTDLNHALNYSPNDPDSHQAKGDLHKVLEQWELALESYHQAASLYVDQGNWAAHQRAQACCQTLEAQLNAKKDDATRIIRVPIKYLSGQTPVIEVLFDGRVRFDMVLDTGASITCLTRKMGHILNITPTNIQRFQMADGRVVEHPVGVVNSAAVGKARVRQLVVTIAPTATEGLLGQNFLKDYDLRILRTEIELYRRS